MAGKGLPLGGHGPRGRAILQVQARTGECPGRAPVQRIRAPSPIRV
ncbi:hypothetical protein FM103_14425 [Corynebacterium xerosis]|nr:hypothetical protein FM103_14425 [Corynebacterium xerosis]